MSDFCQIGILFSGANHPSIMSPSHRRGTSVSLSVTTDKKDTKKSVDSIRRYLGFGVVTQ